MALEECVILHNVKKLFRSKMQNTIAWVYSNTYSRFIHRDGFRILMYHAVGTNIPEDTPNIYNISPTLFEQHMKQLKSVNNGNLIDINNIQSNNKSGIAITFDDGYRDNLHIAAPILKKLNIPFSVFVITNEVKNRNPLFLSPKDIRSLVNEYDVNIGSHSATHARLAECNDHKLKEELISSKHYLEDLLGYEITTISYPHGSVNRRVRDMAENLGYRLGATSKFDINQKDQDPLLLCRTDIWSDDNSARFMGKLNGDWDWYRWRT